MNVELSKNRKKLACILARIEKAKEDFDSVPDFPTNMVESSVLLENANFYLSMACKELKRLMKS